MRCNQGVSCWVGGGEGVRPSADYASDTSGVKKVPYFQSFVGFSCFTIIEGEVTETESDPLSPLWQLAHCCNVTKQRVTVR